MARLTTPALWLPGPLNAINSATATSQADQAGNPIFMGLNPGKLIVLSTNEAQNVAAPGTKLYDGAYQYVQLDSGATAANALAGSPAFMLLDTGGGVGQGTSPENAYKVPTVTTADVANRLGLNSFFCGIFINPATVNGSSTAPTPGNWLMIFAGAGRAAVNVGTVEAVTLGDYVFPDSNHAGAFQGSATAPTIPIKSGVGIEPGAESATAVAYYPDIILKFIG